MKNIKTNALRLLEAAQIPCVEKFYDVSDGRIDALAIAEKIGESPEQVFKTLVTYSNKKEYFVFVVPAAAELDLKKAAAAAGVKSIEMIPSKTLLPTTGYVHGGCSPVGMKKVFPTFIDETAQLYDYICVSAGAIGANVAVDPEMLCKFVPAQYADITK